MIGADRGHLDDLARNQLDPVVLVKDARLAHAMVLVDGEAVRCREGHLASHVNLAAIDCQHRRCNRRASKWAPNLAAHAGIECPRSGTALDSGRMNRLVAGAENGLENFRRIFDDLRYDVPPSHFCGYTS